MGDLSQYDIVCETRAKINRYIYEIERVKSMLPHLNIVAENFGRPKHYDKNKN